jgi:multidrug resistance efflux pump
MRRRQYGLLPVARPVRAVVMLLMLSALASGTDRARGPGQAGAAGERGRQLPENDRVAVILAPRREAVLSAEVTGRVVSVSKELGERFAPGEVLIRLDDLKYDVNKQLAQARLEAAERELAEARILADAKTRQRRAQAVLDAAKANLVATQRLYEEGHASQVDLTNAQRDVTTAEADCELVRATTAKELITATRELAVARGKLDIAAYELNACRIEGPYAGRVKRVLVNEHELVERGTPVMEVVDDGVLLAKFLLPSALFRSVQLGQELELTVSETGQTVAMKVSHVAAVLDPASVTFEVYAEVDNSDGNLRAGMNGSLSLSNVRAR